ncbi:hypothetical protein V2J09_015130 [Rumex salicifolius]
MSAPLPSIQSVYFTEDFIQALRNGEPGKIPHPTNLLRYLYELCWTMVYKDLQFQRFKVALDAAQFSDKPSEDELSSYLADVVTQIAQDMNMPEENRIRVIRLAKWLVDSALVPLRLFQERCEEDFLKQADMMKMNTAQDLKSKEVRVNTRLLYQQTKFNLLREESEGYAKLVTLLCHGSEPSTQNHSASTIGIIKSLIGHFDLDPNRVFDIVLECFELQPSNDLFLDLIPIFPKSHASQILGFKFQYYQRMEVQSSVPFGLYQLAALLVKEDFIDLESICAHLLPKDEEAVEHYNAFAAQRLDEANKIGKINLAATGKDLMDDDKPGDVTVDLYAAVDMETEAIAERSSELETNQSLGLLSGFLSVNDWHHANLLFERLSSLNPVAHIEICEGVFRLIEKSISSAYDIVRRRRLQKSVLATGSTDDVEETCSSANNSLVVLTKDIFQMLACVGPYLHRDTVLLQKVCSVLKAYYQSALDVTNGRTGVLISGSHLNGDLIARLQLREVRPRIEDALGSCLLPSLQLVPASPAVGQAIWQVMSLLPYEARYRLYGEWEKDDERNPMILAARQTAKLDTRRILKRLAKENLKQLGRMVAKLAHANPMTVLRTIVHQIESYKDMIAPVVDAFKYLTQLEYDALEYVVIERLVQGGRGKLKEDGLNLSDWLQSLALFWGHLCKKYPSMELRGLFQYLVNQLKRGKGIELILLQELIQQMANVQYTENMTEDQLDAMAGGESLRYQATSFGITRNNKALIKSTNRLRDSLLPKDEPKLAVPLLLLIAQHRSLVVINADAPYIKMVSEQYDRCHGILLQYVEFLCSAVNPATAYAQLIPSLDDLVQKYHLEPEVAFLIYRPVLRLFKCQGSGFFWPLCDYEAGEASLSGKESDISGHGDLLLDLGSSQKPIRWSGLLDTVRSMLPPKAWNSLSPDLYATFWGLTLYDLYVPRSRYESEIGKLHASLKALEELSDNSSSAIAKRKKDKERIQDSLDRVAGELQRHEENVASVRRRLALEKDTWLSSCPDTLKINMEFLQRCIFPRCTLSAPDAIYCALFVQTLHALGTPYFNTVNHVDVLICKTLHPMICSCTEYEAGRLGRFLYETLKTAYHWKSDESIYERECANKPGFAVYYKFPNRQRVTFAQFVKVHWKWSQRITKILIQCLESAEYMEIRNALIMLTKISSVFPVTRKSGINIEKRVAKIKSDEREDLKVLATSVAAALAARKPAWVTEEEFGMGYLELKQPLAPKTLGNGASGPSQIELNGGRVASGSQHHDSVNRDHSSRKAADGRSEHLSGNVKAKGITGVIGLDSHPETVDETTSRTTDENMSKAEVQSRPAKRAGASVRTSKQDLLKDESKSSKAGGTGGMNSSAFVTNGIAIVSSSKGTTTSVRALDVHGTDMRSDGGATKSSESKGSLRDDPAEVSEVSRPSHARSVHSPRQDGIKADKQQKRSSPAEDPDRSTKRRKGELDIEVDIRSSDKERLSDSRLVEKSQHLDVDKMGPEEQSVNRGADRHSDRLKEKRSDKHDRENRSERNDKIRSDEIPDKARDRSMERHGRERSVERAGERGTDRSFDRVGDKAKDDKIKDDRGKVRHSDFPGEKGHSDERSHGQGLPPPPPLPPHMVPHLVNTRRDEEAADRRHGSTRHTQRLSPRHEEKERRRSEENLLITPDESKRRREDEFRDRKREDREAVSSKVDDRDRERANLVKEEVDSSAALKRRKLKRDAGVEPGEYSPGSLAPPPSISATHDYDGRDRGERKGSLPQRPGYFVDPVSRAHVKEVPGKMARRDADPLYDREWEDENRQRVEPKRRHRK